MRPLLRVVLVPSTPMNDDRLSTAGSLQNHLAPSCCWRSRHGREGNRLRRFRDAQNHAGILHREKSLGNDHRTDKMVARQRGQRPPAASSADAAAPPAAFVP